MHKLVIAGALVVAAVAAGVTYLLKHPERLPDGLRVFYQVSESVPGKRVYTAEPLKSGGSARAGALSTDGVVEWTNRRRTERGLKAYQVSHELSRAARIKALDILNRQYFEHVSPDGVGPDRLASSTGYRFVSVGENLALGGYRSDQELVDAWMDSPGHRENLLSERFLDIGVAVELGTFEGRLVWVGVQEFGKPRSACPAVDDGLRGQIEQKSAEVAELEPQLKELKAELEAQGQPTSSAEAEEYKKRVEHYNSLAERHNARVAEIKSLVERYNGQIDAYNRCIAE